MTVCVCVCVCECVSVSLRYSVCVQLIIIARAIFNNKVNNNYNEPSIIILDEATSNCDDKTNKHITNALNKYFINKTMLVIAHKLDTVMDCDNIYVFDNGEVIENGKPSELLKDDNSLFQKMYHQQQ